MRWILATMLMGVIMLSGCARADQESIDAVRSLFGDQVIKVESSARDGLAVLNVSLESGEPTGTQPFVVLAALARTYPDMREYQTSYNTKSLPLVDDLTVYVWVPSNETIEWTCGNQEGSLGTTFPSGLLLDMDLDLIDAIATGRQSAPQFLPAGSPKSHSSEELANLDATAVVEDYFMMGDVERQAVYALSIEPDEKARASDGGLGTWPQQLSFEVSYVVAAIDENGDPPGQRHFSVIAGKQSADSPWKVLEAKRIPQVTIHAR